jgi:GNAT superfamily N-acetyltransferase
MDIRRFNSRESSEELAQAFAELPDRLYADDPNWVPIPADSTRKLLSADNPFFRYGELEAFVAIEGDRVVGRCAAMINPRLKRDDQQVGLVGFFELEDREEIAKALLDEAVAWLKARGAARVWGPMNFSMWHGYRLMTRGFDKTPFFGEPYNPPHYPQHLERFGFQPMSRYYSWDLDEGHIKEFWDKASPFLPALQAANKGYRIEPIRLDRYDEEVVRIHGVLNESFTNVLEYSSIEADELRSIFDGYDAFMIPELAQLVISPDGEEVGYLATYPDIAPKLRAARNPSGPAEVERLVLHTMALKKAHRRRQVIETFAIPMLKAMLDQGFTKLIGALAREGRTIYHNVAEPTREYTLYAMDL